MALPKTAILRTLNLGTRKSDQKKFAHAVIELEDDHLYDDPGSFGPMYRETWIDWDYFESHSDTLILDCKVSVTWRKGDNGKYYPRISL